MEILKPLTPYYDILDDGKVGWYFGSKLIKCLKIEYKFKGLNSKIISLQHETAGTDLPDLSAASAKFDGKWLMYKVMYEEDKWTDWSEQSATFYARK